MSVTPSWPLGAVPIYLDGGADPVFVTFHPSRRAAARDTGVLLCPPFGFDEVCAYRSLREWAQQLAQSGYPTVRISFPSTGDSGGWPRDPSRLTAWRGAVGDAARWLHSAADVPRVVAIGMGFGGMLAHLAVGGGAAIDDLVIWGTPARGRALVRQIRAFSRLEAAQFFDGLPAPPPLAPGELEAGGFLLGAETVRELEGIDLSIVALPDAAERRVLLLDRDGLAVDAALRTRLQSDGAQVTVARGDGYGDMTSHPQTTRLPQELTARVGAWLGEASATVAGVGGPLSRGLGVASPTAEIKLDAQTTVKETPVAIRQPFGLLTGVLVEPCTRPSSDLCLLLLNAGVVRRIGPSRMWVETARHWAAQGVPTLRLDLEAIGDSDGDASIYSDDAPLYAPTRVPQVLAAVDYLQSRGVGGRFALAGMCAGAYWAFHAALRDPRICAALMVNPSLLIWETGVTPARDLRALLSQRPSLARIRRVATVARVVALARFLIASPRRWLARRVHRGPPAAARDLDAAFEQFRVLGKRALLLFSEHEPLYDELVRSGRMTMLKQWPTVTVERIRVRDHTMRPSWAQLQLRAALDRALERELEHP